MDANRDEMSLEAFLLQIRPRVAPVFLLDDLNAPNRSAAWRAMLQVPRLRMDCRTCGGERYYDPKSREIGIQGDITRSDLDYTCANCKYDLRVFCLRFIYKDEPSGVTLQAYKLGEYPPFTPAVPPRLIKLIGPDKELFLNGRRCEHLGFGVGAFAYYRRLLERQKNRLIDEMIRACKSLGGGRYEAVIPQLESAKKEMQFSKALDDVELPDVLRIRGQSPFSLLHGALSEALHDGDNPPSDQECLELAASIRVVLADLAETLARAQAEDRDLLQAVTRLTARKSKSAPSSKESESVPGGAGKND